MKDYKSDMIRNICVVSHARAGKTSLTEALLYDAGATDKLGRVDNGTTVSDFVDDEIQRKTSINTSLCICEWNGCKINLIDTPGYSDFMGEQGSAIRVSDIMLIIVEATMGVEAGTEKAWKKAEKYGKPRLVFINKLDKEMAKFDETLKALESFGDRIIPVHLPVGIGVNFRGIVDLIKMKAFIKSGDDKNLQEIEIPGDMEEQVAECREALIDAVAETNDELLEKYLDGQTLTDEEISTGLKNGVIKGQFVPVLCGSAYNNIGPQIALDMFINLPSPSDFQKVTGKAPGDGNEVELDVIEGAPLSAFVFKTITDPYAGKVNYFRVYSGTLKADSRVHNSTKSCEERIGNLSLIDGKKYITTDRIVAGDFGAVMKLNETVTNDTLCDESSKIILAPTDFPKPIISMAVIPKTQGDDEKLSTMLTRMSGEDLTFIVRRDSETKETIISGMGELHLNVVLDRIQRRFNVGATMAPPKIPYRETIRSSSEQQGRYKKQTGGRGQYGDVWIKMEPQPRGAGFEFVDDIKSGTVPRQYIPAVEKGLIEALQEGILSGSPVVDVKITLYDGSFHPVDSSELAFKIAASLAFKKAMEACNPFIMEPIQNVEISIPDEYMGTIMSDLNGRRGRIVGVNPENGLQVISAQVPLAEMTRYSVDLRSITSDRGTFSMEFSHYEEVPAEISARIIAAKSAADNS